MIKEYNTKSFIYGIPGVVLQTVGVFMVSSYVMPRISSGTVGPEPWQVLLGRLFCLAGIILLLVGLAYASMAKGRSGWWCLFAVIGIFGLLVLACLRDLTVTEEAKIKKQIAITGRMSKMAVTSLVLGILSIITMFFTAVPGLILGIIALVRIKKDPQKLRGLRVAVWGIILSGMFTVCLLTLLGG